MKVICAWCEQEGRPSFIGERPPLFDARHTHGICPNHLNGYLMTCGREGTNGAETAGPALPDCRYDSPSGPSAVTRPPRRGASLVFRWSVTEWLEKLGVRLRAAETLTGKQAIPSP